MLTSRPAALLLATALLAAGAGRAAAGAPRPAAAGAAAGALASAQEPPRKKGVGKQTSAAARGVVVAVIDGGIDTAHPALAGHLWVNPREVPGNGVDDDKDGIVDDVNGADFVAHSGLPHDESGHGTHVAGIVASVDPSARLMALKAGTGEWIDLAAATQAIYYAVAHGARVINLSWAFLVGDPGLAQAIRYAEAHDVVVVAAAGNFGTSNDLRPVYPAAYGGDALIAVASTCDGSSLAPLSNFGKLTVQIAAPGCQIVSTLPGGGYGSLSGTSMAAPAVAGAAALLLERRPSAHASDIVRALLGGAQPAEPLAGSLADGAVLSVSGALGALGAPDRAPPAPFARMAPAAAFTTQQDPSYFYRPVAFAWTPSADADLAGYRLVVDGVAVAATPPGVAGATVRLAPGAHTWSVTAYDRSGNSTTAVP